MGNQGAKLLVKNILKFFKKSFKKGLTNVGKRDILTKLSQRTADERRKPRTDDV